MDKVLIIRTKLEHDDQFLRTCLLKLYELQEEDEQQHRSTDHDNGVGFNRPDAGPLTWYAEKWKPFGATMNVSSVIAIRERMLKYAGQLARILSQEEIDS